MSRQDGGTPGTPETHDDGAATGAAPGASTGAAPGASTGAAPGAATGARRGRPRSEGVERAVFDAVVGLLDEGVPLAELSIERIARTAGVGKATIYRRWTGKEELFVELLRSVEPPDPVLSGTSVRGDLVVLLESLRERGVAKRTSSLLHNVFAQMQLYPRLWEVYHHTVIEPRRRLGLDTVRRGMEQGEIRDDLDIEFVNDLLTGPLLLRTVIRPGASLEPGLAERVVDTVMEGLRPRD
ncbi:MULTISPECIES: TetR/AcrR family transcriptional regulator [unclassified Streptomyces]|uniref:TetR/AcrR family transcriptional regulator n=1 Tax=unclassified Streptomyces TaxID=2593676 RepID=UPI001E300DCE|nr:TetR/AcrR family transcriptional regulator [Streptomyces sp. CB02980]MCB8908409.1 TetR/AcrR family transcriptional regulator [Streptomyces sp. CB02980]